MGSDIGVEARDGRLRVGERRTAAPQLLLGARIQSEAVLQHGQFLRKTGETHEDESGWDSSSGCSREGGKHETHERVKGEEITSQSWS